MRMKWLGVLFIALIFTGCSLQSSYVSNVKSMESPTLKYVGKEYQGNVCSVDQQAAAQAVIERLIGPDYARYFKVKIQPSEDGSDYFEVKPSFHRIILKGSTGVAATRGLKWYLNHMCQCSITWRGDNLNLPEKLPMNFKTHREETDYPNRYMMNNCIFGYSFAWWKWDDWEHMIDILAYNGINMPAMLQGQEKIWQEAYFELGLTKEDLDGFFAGPAWYPWQWMGNLDGWGGPLPQSVIDGQSNMQKQILNRSRSLGMKCVLPGFSGHIPSALVKKHPGMKCHTMEWWGFEKTYSLDWQDPMFQKISSVFMKKLKEIYGTDHYYNIDPFNEMTPPSAEKEYLANMASTIFKCIDDSDPEGIWVLMTWFCKSENNFSFWNKARTRYFFGAVPDDRMLAIELWGENRSYCGWHWQDGWYKKPWVWSILQNFGNRVDLYGSLNQIFDNYHEMKHSLGKGNLQGMGIMSEGLGYNPVVYELMLDMMWGNGVLDLDAWKADYLVRRYGENPPEAMKKAWEVLYKKRYNQTTLVDITPFNFAPRFSSAFNPDIDSVDTWKYMLEAADELKDNEAYQYDLVMAGREAMGNFALYYPQLLQDAVNKKDLKAYREAKKNLLQYIRDFDALLCTNEHLLLGKWLQDARHWGENQQESELMEWGAKRQITDWGGKIGSYAVKEWGGYYVDAVLPVWDYYVEEREKAITDPGTLDLKALNKKCKELTEKWPKYQSYLNAEPQGDAIELSRRFFRKYSDLMYAYDIKSGTYDIRKLESVPGIGVGKVAKGSSIEGTNLPEFAVDGKVTGKYWAGSTPSTFTVDLGADYDVAAFHLFPYAEDNRCYQYTIEISVDGENWMQVVDMATNQKNAPKSGHFHPFTAGYDFRYARVNMQHNSVNSSVHIVEFKILTTEDVEKMEALK